MAPKVLRLVRSCGECPHYVYYSGGVHHCVEVGEAVIDKHVIAPFCPLADYPAHAISSMETTIRLLREPNDYGFGLALLTHVATKLKLNLAPSARGITIAFKDGGKERSVFFGTDYITAVDLHRGEITFRNGEGKFFRLAPDIEPPILWESAEKDGWYEHRLRQ